jgi:peptidoglycan/xylan/chitin deacetylase (PgdA/CDA1 family)
MKQKTALLTFDLEEFVAPKEHSIPCDEKELFTISIDGLLALLAVLQKNNVHATFFTTVTFAKDARVEKILKQLLKDGQEVALHGYDHMDIYAYMTQEEVRENLKEAKNYLERKFKIKIHGFRAPRLQNVSLSLLKNLGFFYEASLHPTLVPGHYNNFFASRKIKEKEGITQVPISVTPLLRAPLSWVWFRNFGISYMKICTLLTFYDSDFVHLYFHPWDFYNFKKSDRKWQLPWFYFTNTDKSILMLDSYIAWLQKKNVTFKTIQEHLEGKK